MKQRSIVAALGGIAVVATWLFQFGVDRRAVLSSLAAGTYRFKVFPEDIDELIRNVAEVVDEMGFELTPTPSAPRS